MFELRDFGDLTHSSLEQLVCFFLMTFITFKYRENSVHHTDLFKTKLQLWLSNVVRNMLVLCI